MLAKTLKVMTAYAQSLRNTLLKVHIEEARSVVKNARASVCVKIKADNAYLVVRSVLDQRAAF